MRRTSLRGTSLRGIAPLTWLGVTLALLGVTGCTGGLGHMRVAAADQAVRTPPDKATIVFQRSGSMPKTVFTLQDATGRFICDLGTREWCAVDFDPGSHEILLMTTGAFAPHKTWDRLEANVAAGRVYYVWLYTKYGSLGMEVMRPAHPRWSEHTRWLREHARVIPDGAAGTAEIREDPDQLEEDVEDARELWAEMEPSLRQARMMRPEDGLHPAGRAAPDARATTGEHSIAGAAP